jgi:hypothetical protein
MRQWRQDESINLKTSAQGRPTFAVQTEMQHGVQRDRRKRFDSYKIPKESGLRFDILVLGAREI